MVVVPVVDLRQAHRPWAVLHEIVKPDGNRNAQESRTPEPVAPAEVCDERGDGDERESLADGMRGTPDSIEAAAFAVAVPVRERDDACRRAEALEPAVERPQQHRDSERRGKPHAEIRDRRKHHTERKKHFHVRVIGEEAGHQLADGITVEQPRTDEAEFDRGEDTLVDQRFFHDRQREPAGVHETVTQGDRNQHAHSVPPILAIYFVAVGQERLVRTSAKEVQECLQTDGTPFPVTALTALIAPACNRLTDEGALKFSFDYNRK